VKIEIGIKMKSLNSSSKWVLLAGLLTASALMSMGVDVHAQDQVQTQVQIYGSQLMTPAERTEYQSKMRALKTEKGVTLPNSPPAVGAGQKANTGTGVGPGSGVGAGQGAPASPPGGGKGPGR
jgi:hypothetical protein